MSNNNRYWGRRFGSFDDRGEVPKGFYFKVRQLASGRSNSGPHQLGYLPGSARHRQSVLDKEWFRLNGRPTIYIYL